LGRIIAENVLPLPRFRGDQVRRLGDALSQLLRGTALATAVEDTRPQSYQSRRDSDLSQGGVRGQNTGRRSDEGTAVVGIGGVVSSSSVSPQHGQGRRDKAPPRMTVDTDSEEEELGRMAAPCGAARGGLGLTSPLSQEEQVFGSQQQRQVMQQQGRPSPSGMSSSANSSGLSAYAQRRNTLGASGAGSCASSSASMGGAARPKKAPMTAPTFLLSKIRNDPTWAAGAGADHSEDEIVDEI
jgi:hypothetical protein